MGEGGCNKSSLKFHQPGNENYVVADLVHVSKIILYTWTVCTIATYLQRG